MSDYLATFIRHLREHAWTDEVFILSALFFPGSLILLRWKSSLFFEIDIMRWIFLSILISAPIFAVCRYVTKHVPPFKKLFEASKKLATDYDILTATFERTSDALTQQRTEIDDLKGMLLKKGGPRTILLARAAQEGLPIEVAALDKEVEDVEALLNKVEAAEIATIRNCIEIRNGLAWLSDCRNPYRTADVWAAHLSLIIGYSIALPLLVKTVWH